LAAPLRTISRRQIQYIRELLSTKRTRDQEGVFVLEGAKPILELLRSAPDQVVEVVVTSNFLDRHTSSERKQVLEASGRVYSCPMERFSPLSDVDSSQGILALVRRPTWDQQTILARPRLLGVYGDRLQDPTNLGSIIRTAAALDIGGLWLTAHSVDVFNPKVVRATAGTLFRLPIFLHAELQDLVQAGCTVLAADSAHRDSISLRSIHSLPARTIVALGSEGQGLSPATLQAARTRLTVPLRKGVESLNVAAAAAMILYHLSGLPSSR